MLASDIIPKIQLNKINTVESVNDNIVKVYSNQDSATNEEKETYQKLIQKAKQNNSTFNFLIQRFVVPIKFSFLALVSARKDTIFGDYLISLMEYVAKRTLDGMNICLNNLAFGQEELKQDEVKDHPEVDLELDPSQLCNDFLQEHRTRYEVTKICYVLDDMASDPIIVPKPVGFKKNAVRKQHNLVQYFSYRMRDPEESKARDPVDGIEV